MVRVYGSAVIDGPVEAVWAQLQDFSNVGHWHPTVARCEVEAGASGRSVGCTRNLELKDGSRLREQLLALSDHGRTYTYAVLSSPLPIANYVGVVRLSPVTETNQTFAEWTAEFDVTSGPAQAMVDLVRQGLISTGFAGLNGKVREPHLGEEAARQS